ncbi:disintegrin and metalloproteinase domain-containing protein 30 [Pteronotus mesoamericanus]|uniref:disintegrin and metalloproteinase domain-containing protein 30 n=1 Tax=Pteronotus mesoamericanus TaxID=1884717 RepID=UPI0023ED66DD|nr:disintegrin and metalloproteinase domain-containing protein 30 [Pteronotus parnellii mesoamericanus]
MRSVRAALSRGHLLHVLVLAVLLVDTLGEDLIFHRELGFDSYEITIPKKLSFRGGEQGVANHVSYLLQVKGKKHVLHLWPKRFLLPRHLPVFSYTGQGQLLEDYPYIPRDCNYMGLVEGVEDSEATFSTCSEGLRGILKIDSKYYQVEPLKTSSTFEHIVYLLKNEEEFQDQICGLIDEATEEQMGQPENMARRRDFTGPSTHTKYLELGLIFDNERYLYSNSNLTEVTNDAILLTSIMDTYFQELHVRIQLSALEVWTDKDKVDIGFSTLQEALGQFLIYQRNVLSTMFSADWAQLYTKRRYIDALAWSWGKVCTMRYAGSVSVFPDNGLLGPATWGAHNLGHSVGMNHDDKYCRCKGRRSCIMGTGRIGFSNCSFIHFFNHVRREANCLNNIPKQLFVVKRCGNKIVEDDEECDCGSLENCETDLCCQPGCKFRDGANCSIGLCCHNCHFRPSGYMCRKEENECDLAEYCDGASGFCPTDTYKQDGTPCKYEARCFRKGCRSTYMQCQSIFGSDAREAPDQCYEAVNLIGDQFGNCGIIGSGSYKKCTRTNAICGRVQCINVRTLPDMPDYTNVISTHLGDKNLKCWGIGYHQSLVPMGIPDVGAVNDGTSCGTNRICVNTTCMDSSILNFDCLPQKCNHRGFCNNNKNCHCMYGWAPPLCEEAGYGGSVDSGPPGMLNVGVPDSVQITFLILLRLILLLITVIIVFFRQLIGNYLTPPPTETPLSNTEVRETPLPNTNVKKPKAKTIKRNKV